jgi:hypothetical protein
MQYYIQNFQLGRPKRSCFMIANRVPYETTIVHKRTKTSADGGRDIRVRWFVQPICRSFLSLCCEEKLILDEKTSLFLRANRGLEKSTRPTPPEGVEVWKVNYNFSEYIFDL